LKQAAKMAVSDSLDIFAQYVIVTKYFIKTLFLGLRIDKAMK